MDFQYHNQSLSRVFSICVSSSIRLLLFSIIKSAMLRFFFLRYLRIYTLERMFQRIASSCHKPLQTDFLSAHTSTVRSNIFCIFSSKSKGTEATTISSSSFSSKNRLILSSTSGCRISSRASIFSIGKNNQAYFMTAESAVFQKYISAFKKLFLLFRLLLHFHPSNDDKSNPHL